MTRILLILSVFLMPSLAVAQGGPPGDPGDPGGDGNYPPAYGYEFDNFIYEVDFATGLAAYKLTSMTFGDSIVDLELQQGGWPADLDTEIISEFEQTGYLDVFDPNPTQETTDVIMTTGSPGTNIVDHVTLKKVNPMFPVKVTFDKNIARKRANGNWDIKSRFIFNNATANPITCKYYIAVGGGGGFVPEVTFTIPANSSICKVTGAFDWPDAPTGAGGLGHFELGLEINDHLGNELQWHDDIEAPVEYVQSSN